MTMLPGGKMVAMEINRVRSPKIQNIGAALSRPGLHKLRGLQLNESNASISDKNIARCHRDHQRIWIKTLDAEVAGMVEKMREKVIENALFHACGTVEATKRWSRCW